MRIRLIVHKNAPKILPTYLPPLIGVLVNIVSECYVKYNRLLALVLGFFILTLLAGSSSNYVNFCLVVGWVSGLVLASRV